MVKEYEFLSSFLFESGLLCDPEIRLGLVGGGSFLSREADPPQTEKFK